MWLLSNGVMKRKNMATKFKLKSMSMLHFDFVQFFYDNNFQLNAFGVFI